MKFCQDHWSLLQKEIDANDPPLNPHTDVVRKSEKATRDGAPKLAAERKRGDLALRKRHRAGPNWVPRDRRPE